MSNDRLAFFLTVIGTICWGVCFWWMHRISRRQDSMLHELREQGHRIERLSQAEHDLIQEVHPKVEEISQDMSRVAAAVEPGRRRGP